MTTGPVAAVRSLIGVVAVPLTRCRSEARFVAASFTAEVAVGFTSTCAGWLLRVSAKRDLPALSHTETGSRQASAAGATAMQMNASAMRTMYFMATELSGRRQVRRAGNGICGRRSQVIWHACARAARVPAPPCSAGIRMKIKSPGSFIALVVFLFAFIGSSMAKTAVLYIATQDPARAGLTVAHFDTDTGVLSAPQMAIETRDPAHFA